MTPHLDQLAKTDEVHVCLRRSRSVRRRGPRDDRQVPSAVHLVICGPGRSPSQKLLNPVIEGNCQSKRVTLAGLLNVTAMCQAVGNASRQGRTDRSGFDVAAEFLPFRTSPVKSEYLIAD
jgi:hypothetical protein